MAPIKPDWIQPSHPEILQVVYGNDVDKFQSKTYSIIRMPPNSVFAKLTEPPCSIAQGPSYDTVQVAKDIHLQLNSDLMYLDHSCDPSLIVDTAQRTIFTGPQGLIPGQELTFFYPSTEWSMDQPFDCNCRSQNCLGRISGARFLNPHELKGRWINHHILEMFRDSEKIRLSSNSCAPNP
ncbi:unnamed protein product [Blumeria hordei]|uniref:Post-SET domain-containing protein n=1 Tax=Blumeria hordei TaxID=2867405 RepID=A0A383UR99_BLUHO|nr:unnamed protein product [Blumeria hordei]